MTSTYELIQALGGPDECAGAEYFSFALGSRLEFHFPVHKRGRLIDRGESGVASRDVV